MRPVRPFEEPRIVALIADDDAAVRSLVIARARAEVESLVVLQADEGAAALRLGLEHRPHVALLDVEMPRLDGIDVAVALQALHPQTRVAVYTGDPHTHRDRAHAHRLPVFDKLELDRTIEWLKLQAARSRPLALRPPLSPKLSFECSVCRYGVSRTIPPDRCPICQLEGTWTHAPWRPFTRTALPAH